MICRNINQKLFPIGYLILRLQLRVNYSKKILYDYYFEANINSTSNTSKYLKKGILINNFY